MRTPAVTFALATMAAAACWWPSMVEGGLKPPAWLVAGLLTLYSALAATLHPRQWWMFAAISPAGTFAGLCSGYWLWPPQDSIAGSYVPLIVAIAIAIAALLGPIGAFAGAKLHSHIANRRFAWIALLASSAYGPAALALTQQVTAYRMDRNDKRAAERFAALQRALRDTAPGQRCDGLSLRRNYFGRHFSVYDWTRITGNYVTQDGYSYMVYCREKDGYILDARPFRSRGMGTRRFCSDESGKQGCGMDWNASRHICLPCGQ